MQVLDLELTPTEVVIDHQERNQSQCILIKV